MPIPKPTAHAAKAIATNDTKFVFFAAIAEAEALLVASLTFGRYGVGNLVGTKVRCGVGTIVGAVILVVGWVVG